MTRQRVLLAMAGLVIAAVCGLFGLSAKLGIQAKNEPVSTIGKSGDFKSPGGSSEESERRRI
jgi:hypothetical protein